MIKHIEQPRQTVRQVLTESGAARVRVSVEAKNRIGDFASEKGLTFWQAADLLLGVSNGQK